MTLNDAGRKEWGSLFDLSKDGVKGMEQVCLAFSFLFRIMIKCPLKHIL